MFHTDAFSYKDYQNSASHKNEETEKIFLSLTRFLCYDPLPVLPSTQLHKMMFLMFGTILMACQKLNIGLEETIIHEWGMKTAKP